MDLTKLPSGNRSWKALIEWAASSDDRNERYFVEFKSDVDLNSKHGRHKVAKFILGAANRDPKKALRRFEGRGILLLGVEKNRISGVPSFEAKDLEREVQKFTGVEGPLWDFEQIEAENGAVVVAIIVDTPTGDIWPSLSDGESLKNGDVYLRGDGDTRKASGAELTSMLARRAASEKGLPALSVEVSGAILALEVNIDGLGRHVDHIANEYLRDIEPVAKSQFGALNPAYLSGGALERRSREEYTAEIEAWRSEALSSPLEGLRTISARLAPVVQLLVSNLERVSLKGVRLDLEFEAAVSVVPWQEFELPSHEMIFPERPERWGSASWLRTSPSQVLLPPVGGAAIDGRLIPVRDSASSLTLSLSAIRPEESFRSDTEDIVLVMYVEQEPSKEISARWKLTSVDVDDVAEGVLSVPVRYLAWDDLLSGGIVKRVI